AVHPRHPDVHQGDVRSVFEHGRQRLSAIRRLTDHRNACRAQDHPEAAANESLVVGDHHTAWCRRIAHRPPVAAASGAPAGAPPPGSSSWEPTGKRARTIHPPPLLGPASNVPPYSAIRSRSPTSPRRAPGGTAGAAAEI